MPATEAQKRATAKWIANNKEKHNIKKLEWAKRNYDRVREIDNAYKQRRREYEGAIKALMRCLL
jgi:hypothetical protein